MLPGLYFTFGQPSSPPFMVWTTTGRIGVVPLTPTAHPLFELPGSKKTPYKAPETKLAGEAGLDQLPELNRSIFAELATLPPEPTAQPLLELDM